MRPGLRSTRGRAAWALVGLVAAACGTQDGKGVDNSEPAEVIRAAGDALGQARSFRVEGSYRDSDGTFTYRSTVSRRGEATVTDVVSGGRRGRFESRTIGNRVYVQGRLFWELYYGDSPTVPAEVGDGWGVLTFDAPTAPASTPFGRGRCLVAGYPRDSLRPGGPGQVGDRRGVVVIDTGGRPGSWPSRLVVAGKGTPYPLAEEQTGPQTLGGGDSPTCPGGSESDGSTRDSRTRWSGFNDRVAPLQIPAAAVDVNALLARPG